MLHKGWWGTNKHDLRPGDWGQSLLVKGQNHLVKKKKKKIYCNFVFLQHHKILIKVISINSPPSCIEAQR